MQCIERGMLLKSIFDSYVRMVDLIFADSLAQRKLLSHKFAQVYERQVFLHKEHIQQKQDEIDAKDNEIINLKG